MGRCMEGSMGVYMPPINVYKSHTQCREVEVDVRDDDVAFSEAEVGAMNYAAVVSFTRDEAIAVARAILKHFNCGMEE